MTLCGGGHSSVVRVGDIGVVVSHMRAVSGSALCLVENPCCGWPSVMDLQLGRPPLYGNQLSIQL
jgi:hypothetical protein